MIKGAFPNDGQPASFTRLAEAGCKIANFYSLWTDLELRKGTYTLENIAYLNDQCAANGLDLSLEIEVIEPGGKVPSYPAGYTGTPSGVSVRNGLVDLVEWLRYSHAQFPRLKWLWLGNEVDAYFRRYPRRVAAWAETLRQSRAVADGVFQVGTVIALHDAYKNNQLDMVRRLWAPCSLLGYTYYPQMLSENATSIWAYAINPYAIVETAFSSAEFLGTEQRQVEYWTWLSASDFSTRAAFTCWWTLDDLPPETVASLGFTGEMAEWVSKCGLCHQDGRPKPVWDAFKET